MYHSRIKHVTPVDAIALPGSMNFLITDIPCPGETLQQIAQLPNIVTVYTTESKSDIYIHLVASFGPPFDVHDLSLGDTLPWWHIHLRHWPSYRTFVSPPPPSPEQSSRWLALSGRCAGILSALNIRQSLKLGLYQRFELGRTTYHRLALLLNESDGVWMVSLPCYSLDQILNSIKLNVSTVEGKESIEIGYMVELESDTTSSHQPPFQSHGQLSSSIRSRLAASPRIYLNTSIPPPLPTPQHDLLPLIRRWFIIARVVASSNKEQLSVSLARQILTSLSRPPPVISPDFHNVGEIILLVENATNVTLPFHHRLMIHDLTDGLYKVDAGDIITCTNITRLTIHHEELKVLMKLDSQIQFQGLVEVGSSMGDRDDEVWSESDENLCSQDLLRYHLLQDELLTSLTPFMEVRKIMSTEFRFYRGVHLMMDRLLDNLPNLSALHQSTNSFQKQHRIPRFLTLVRVSQGVKSPSCAFTASLQHQSAFLHLVAPHAQGSIALDNISIGRSNVRVMRELGKVSDCLVWITSIDRAARSMSSWYDVESICRSNNITLVSCFWPATTIIDLIKLPNPLLTQNTISKQLFLDSSHKAVDVKSLPSLFLCIIAGPLVDPAISQLAAERVRHAQTFIAGLSTPHFTYDPAIQIDQQIYSHKRLTEVTTSALVKVAENVTTATSRWLVHVLRPGRFPKPADNRPGHHDMVVVKGVEGGELLGTEGGVAPNATLTRLGKEPRTCSKVDSSGIRCTRLAIPGTGTLCASHRKSR
ncbi:hypothetical protein I204_03047 [Kwoniella mangroviensis CBS 8886]|nr:hypothetical protein I204_03047 [Kwoniella mangroviensis CBS 8886]